MRKKGVVIWACSPAELDYLLGYISSMDLKVHPCQFSKVYNNLQIFSQIWNKSLDYMGSLVISIQLYQNWYTYSF